MSKTNQLIEKYQRIAKRYKLVLKEADIMYLQSYMRSIIKEEVLKMKNKYERR